MYMVTYFDHELKSWVIVPFYTFEYAHKYYELCLSLEAVTNVRLSKEVEI